jgi:hypothetical protein
MALNPRTRLGTHEIVAPIGAGGRGEFYKVRGTKFGRDSDQQHPQRVRGARTTGTHGEPRVQRPATREEALNGNRSQDGK